MRPLATTMIHSANPGYPSHVLLTVIPRPVLSILGVRAPRSATWTKAGDSYRVVPSATRPKGAVPLQNTRTHMAAIPWDIANELGLGDGAPLDWYVDAGGDRWTACVRGPQSKKPDGTPQGSGGWSGPVSRRPLGDTMMTRYTYDHYGCVVVATAPRAALRLLGADGPGYVRWERDGHYHAVHICGPSHRDGRRITGGQRSDRGSGYSTRIPRRVADGISTKRKAILRWYAATDGRGRWGVQVRAVDR